MRFEHGSSPLSRGIRQCCNSVYGSTRIIPALAGNTRGSTSGRRIPMDHPRSRGEYYLGPQEDNQHLGSSPLSRGIRVGPTPDRRGRRIIPALAGNTNSATPSNTPNGDHPRSRGEYRTSVSTHQTSTGSSPLSRGIPKTVSRTPAHPRIIPALAGNTSVRCQRSCSRWDHPRSRGEYPAHATLEISKSGSSPLSRGIRDDLLQAEHCDGIIPALAGNTLSAVVLPCEDWDHPRSRGEYHGQLLSAHACEGSSPLSRGIRAVVDRGGNIIGIIPALAGNTTSIDIQTWP